MQIINFYPKNRRASEHAHYMRAQRLVCVYNYLTFYLKKDDHIKF